MLASATLEMRKGMTYDCVDSKCLFIYGTIYDSEKDQVLNTTITFFFEVWRPMALIVIIYVLLYLKLKQQGQLQQQKSSRDSRAQMMTISRTFTVVVLVHFVSYLPHTIVQIMYDYSQYHDHYGRFLQQSYTFHKFFDFQQ